VESTRWLAVVAIAGVIGVLYGGWALLTFTTGREGLSGAQQRFFRDGHAHAGVLLVLSLVYFQYLERTDFSDTARWIAGGVLIAGVLLQSTGFFLHMMQSEPLKSGSAGTRTTRSGALLIGAALGTLAIGLAAA
jgi:hypothetical protein